MVLRSFVFIKFVTSKRASSDPDNCPPPAVSDEKRRTIIEAEKTKSETEIQNKTMKKIRN